MTLKSWARVAAGIQLVAQTAAKQAAKDAGTTATRAVQQGAEVATSTRTALAASHQWQHHPPTSTPTPAPYAPPINGSGATESPWNGLGNHDTGRASASSEPFFGTATADETTTNDTGILNEKANFQESQEAEAEAIEVPPTQAPVPPESDSQNIEPSTDNAVAAENQIRSAAPDDGAVEDVDTDASASPVEEQMQRLKEGRAVPSSRAGRAMGFASLGFGLAMGTASEGVSRLFGQSSGGSSVAINDANADRLSESLCRMRGAALKMGQMLSIQDEALLPPALSRALQKVRQGADAMPNYQLMKQLKRQLGKDWRDKFETFEESPFAAASIGQVHRATIRDDAGEIRDVVVKVQYPGVANSIGSDLNNLKMLVTWSGLAPKGLFIENVMRVGQAEMQVECDYLREMKNQTHIKQLVESDPVLQENRFVVPEAIEALTTGEVLVSEYRPGGTIDKVSHLDQEERNRIGRTIMYLTMQELFVWRFMQTDPNWGNFLYDVNSRTTSLIDFGATREYTKEFVDGYLRIVWASANSDENKLMEQSYRMNFLTGDENEEMVRAHKMSGFTVGEPFAKDEPFDFKESKISTRMGEHTTVFLKHRLTAPPEEVYTLHRKLAGAYMLCIKLGAVIRSRDMLEDIVTNHVFEDGMAHPIKG